MNPVPYDPKLREAMAEIRAVFAKHDIAGCAVIASPTHSEFLFEPEATWSLCYWEDRVKGALRFRSKRADFASKEEQDRKTGATVHMLESIRWITQNHHQQMSVLRQLLDKHMTILTDIKYLTGVPDSVPGDGR